MSDMELSRLEALQKQRGELEAQHAGEMTYTKLHHEEQIEHLQKKHNEEVSCTCSSKFSWCNIFVIFLTEFFFRKNKL